MNKKLLIFASGLKDGGGSGFEKLCENVLAGVIQADIVAVVSNHANGGVKARADIYNIPFIHFEKPWTAERYQQIVRETGADFVALSGWLKLVSGLDPKTTINIHPGPLPTFGGPGLYGHYVHEAVMEAYHKGLVTHSAVSMHFVTERYDEGPVFFEYKVKILPDDTSETLAARVNKAEHEWQSKITNKVIQGEIAWDGHNPASLIGKEVQSD